MKYDGFLPQYYNVLNKQIKPKYLITKHTPVSFKKTDSTEYLWNLHQDVINQKADLINQDIFPKQSLLDLKIELSKRIYHQCHFCEHNCQIDRSFKKGFCKINNSYIASAFTHMGEERILIPSFTIFFSGCNFQCVFCQNHNISQNPTVGIKANDFNIKDVLLKNQQSIKNINWVGGDPTPHVKTILELLKKIDIPLAQIWNSNMYCSKETMSLLDGVIDMYLTDFKFGNNACGRRLSGAESYWDVVTRNHVLASKQTDVVIRHLLLPNHQSCCTKPIIDWISHNLHHYLMHFMNQYYPSYKAKKIDTLNSYVTNDEYFSILKYAQKHKIMLYLEEADSLGTGEINILS